MAISDVLLEGGLTFKKYFDGRRRVGVKILRFFGGTPSMDGLLSYYFVAISLLTKKLNY